MITSPWAGSTKTASRHTGRCWRSRSGLSKVRTCLRWSPASTSASATSLPFIVAATAIGVELGVSSPATGAALVMAGLFSVLLFLLGALKLLRKSERRTPTNQTEATT